MNDRKVNVIAPQGMTGLACAPFRKNEIFAVAANWKNASDPVFHFSLEGWEQCGKQVSDYQHRPRLAMEDCLAYNLYTRGEKLEIENIKKWAFEADPLVSSEVGLIADVLRLFGDRFAGDDPYSQGEEWLDDCFSAEEVEKWCEIGVWNSWVASQLWQAGVSPEDAKKGHDCLAEKAKEGSFRSDAIYSCCNSDLDIKVLISAAKSH